MGSPRRMFPDGRPLAVLRAGPVDMAEMDDVVLRLQNCCDSLSRKALALIQAQAAYIVAMENELGHAYFEGAKHAA
jgi:hypothetical protein